MPIYTLYCKKCGFETEEFLSIDTKEFGKCKCGEQLTKAVDCSHFKLIHDPKTQSCGWGFNNYSHNCYWDDVKKQRAEGKDVKACNEK